MEMTAEQRAVLAYMVEDPDEWFSHNLAASPDEAEARRRLEAKVSRWKPAYEAAKAKAGYQTRAEREEAAEKARSRKV